MKKLIYGIYIVFIALTAVTFYMAAGTYDGLVDEHYYEKAAHFFDRGSGKKSDSECGLSQGPCEAEVDGKKITFDITPKPVRAMEEVSFKVALSEKGREDGLRELTIDLGMPGMYMGRNRVVIKRTAEGDYAGKGIIPRCPSGKTLWMATVRISEADSASFLFNVKY